MRLAKPACFFQLVDVALGKFPASSMPYIIPGHIAFVQIIFFLFGEDLETLGWNSKILPFIPRTSVLQGGCVAEVSIDA